MSSMTCVAGWRVNVNDRLEAYALAILLMCASGASMWLSIRILIQMQLPIPAVEPLLRRFSHSFADSIYPAYSQDLCLILFSSCLFSNVLPQPNITKLLPLLTAKCKSWPRQNVFSGSTPVEIGNRLLGSRQILLSSCDSDRAVNYTNIPLAWHIMHYNGIIEKKNDLGTIVGGVCKVLPFKP